MHNLLDNLPTQILNSEQFDECNISYALTFSFMGQSITVTAEGTAATCAEAGNIARSGLKSEADKAKALVVDIID